MKTLSSTVFWSSCLHKSCMNFGLHDFFLSPKNLHLKALLYFLWSYLEVGNNPNNNMSNTMCNRWVSVVEFHDQALSIGKVFGQESSVVKWNYQILGLHQVTVHQKLGVILVKFIYTYSEKATKFCEISTNYLSYALKYFSCIAAVKIGKKKC